MTEKLPFPERILRQHFVALGKTGSGKSSVLRAIAEHLLDKRRRLAVIDPKGDWWGLKSSADGKSAGYPVIMFGDFKEPRATDVPINDASGKEVAELIATGNRPCVLGFRGWMPAQLVRFWLDFAPALFNRNEGELYVVIDEVHNLAPKGKILDPNSGKALHWTNRILSEGRGLGMTFGIASQRPQKVHNDTLENCETLIAMRVTHPRSREATEEWINAKGDRELGKEVVSTLAQLKTGEAWVWSPDNEFGPRRVTFPMFSTFDSFAPPQLQKKVSESGWSEVDLDQVKQKLATVIAEAKANDPRALKAEVMRLKQELAKPKPAAAPAADPTLATKLRLAQNAERELQHAANRLAELLKRFRDYKPEIDPRLERLQQTAHKIIGELGFENPNFTLAEVREKPATLSAMADRARDRLYSVMEENRRPRPAAAYLEAAEAHRARSSTPPAADRSAPSPTLPRPTIKPPAPPANGSEEALRKTEREILRAVLQAQPRGADLSQLTVLTGYRRSTRNRAIQYLQQKALVEKRDGKVFPTEAGVQALGDVESLPTGAALARYWLERLSGPERKILEYVLQVAGPGATVDREAISEATGYMRSTRNRAIQYLQARHLLKRGAGAVEPDAMLFDDAEAIA